MNSENPKLRCGLEATLVEREGERYFLLHDRLGHERESLIISPPVLRLLAEMNGKNSLRDLQALHMRATGELIHMEDLEKILRLLDDRLFLDNDRYRSFLDGEIRRFETDPVRRMWHAGKSYPEDPEALRSELGNLFGGQKEPREAEPRCADGRLVGLVAPHIDIRAGSGSFARAYQACLETIPPEIWVILGTGHEPIPNHYALLAKGFETPLGVVHCDREACEYLQRHAPRDILAGSYNHRMEHTIEFQAVFLALLQPTARIVPLLCSFSEEDWQRDRTYIDEISGLLRELVAVRGGSVGFLASVDLAHIGPRYGDAFIPNRTTVEYHLSADRLLLKMLEGCRADEFMQEIVRDGNGRRICGTAPLYTLTKVLEGMAKGEVLDHSFAPADNQNSFVTFAGMAFYETGCRWPATKSEGDFFVDRF